MHYTQGLLLGRLASTTSTNLSVTLGVVAMITLATYTQRRSLNDCGERLLHCHVIHLEWSVYTKCEGMDILEALQAIFMAI